MAEAIDVALLPIRMAWRLVKLLFAPLVAIAIALGLAWIGATWCLIVAAAAAVWGAVMIWLWWL